MAVCRTKYQADLRCERQGAVDDDNGGVSSKRLKTLDSLGHPAANSRPRSCIVWCGVHDKPLNRLVLCTQGLFLGTHTRDQQGN